MEGISIAETAAIVAMFAGAVTVLNVVAEWLKHWLGLAGQVQDQDRATLKTRQDKHEATTEGWYRELHARISEEQTIRQAGDKEIIASLHKLEVDVTREFATKSDLMATEARIIDAFNRNMDRREQMRGRGGQQ